MPDHAPFWSVVIPLYNKGPYIEATVASVLAQSDPDFEIVVVDDGSRDEGPDRVAAMSDPRVRLIRQANGGVSAARNRGIAEARGVFVAFLDGDDLYHPACLAVLKAAYERSPEIKILSGGYERVPHAQMADHLFKKMMIPQAHVLIRNLPLELLRSGMPFFTSSVAVRRSSLMEMDEPFPVGESMGEDLDLWFRLCEHEPIAWVDMPIAVYRVGIADSLVGSYRASELLPVWSRLEHRALAMKSGEELRRSSLRLVAEMRLTLARVLAAEGAKNAAFKLWVSAWRSIGGRRWWFTLLILFSPRFAASVR
ncbi:glycosyltransferase family 2 protein [Paucibacter sp. DJ1R-11]|uniref:glycosyltransferase family 2 protein n=1 Tax=Paucibacter sp. DJ1R-11 TaxID=2893556 RepID=UPI0021E49869|nr:glycosyltransferase family 2 protein [Paucibacter sp. DJ1R-11]MCV2365066.1 glycosyltransferase family 2 protein [Paucibacter sp. DJ1R-11]